MLLGPYFELLWYPCPAMRQAHFRVAKISFYIRDYTFTTKYLGEWAIASHGRILVPQGVWWFQYVNILYIE